MMPKTKPTPTPTPGAQREVKKKHHFPGHPVSKGWDGSRKDRLQTLTVRTGEVPLTDKQIKVVLSRGKTIAGVSADHYSILTQVPYSLTNADFVSIVSRRVAGGHTVLQAIVDYGPTLMGQCGFTKSEVVKMAAVAGSARNLETICSKHQQLKDKGFSNQEMMTGFAYRTGGTEAIIVALEHYETFERLGFDRAMIVTISKGRTGGGVRRLNWVLEVAETAIESLGYHAKEIASLAVANTKNRRGEKLTLSASVKKIKLQQNYQEPRVVDTTSTVVVANEHSMVFNTVVTQSLKRHGLFNKQQSDSKRSRLMESPSDAEMVVSPLSVDALIDDALVDDTLERDSMLALAPEDFSFDIPLSPLTRDDSVGELGSTLITTPREGLWGGDAAADGDEDHRSTASLS